MGGLRVIVECGYSDNGIFRRNIFIEESKVNSFRLQHNNIEVYTSAFKYDSRDIASANIIGDFYMDFDTDLASGGEKAFQALKKDVFSAIKFLNRVLLVELDQIRLYFSGNKGFHLIVPQETLGLKPCNNMNGVFKIIVEEIASIAKNGTIDTKIYDKRRLFRMPLSKNGKSNLYKIPVTLQEFYELTIEDIKKLSASARTVIYAEPKFSLKTANLYSSFETKYLDSFKTTNVDISTPLNIIPPCIKYLLDNPIPKGQRNNTATALCSFFKQHGYTAEESKTAMFKWNEERCTPALRNDEINTIVRSIYSKEYKFGCSTMKNLSECNKNECQLVKK